MTLAGFSEDLLDIQRLSRDVFASLKTIDAARDLEARGCYDEAWSRLVTETGLAGIAAPESAGGAGMPLSALFVVAEEAGRALFAGPYLSTCVLSMPLLSDFVEGEEDLVASLAAGAVTATFGCAGHPASWATTDPPALTVAADGTVTGTLYQVPDAVSSDVLVAPAQIGSAAGLVAVELRADGCDVKPLPQVDTTMRSGTISLDRANARVLQLRELTAQEVVARTLALGRLGLAAAQIGGARRVLDLALAYVQQRQQFGRPVGAFQAVKHLCADSTLRLETNWAAVAQLVRSLGDHVAGNCTKRDARIDLVGAAGLIKASVSQAYRDIARDALHLHGGIGFTWEHDCHLYFKNAQATAAMLGSPAELRAELASRTLEGDVFTPIVKPPRDAADDLAGTPQRM